MKPPAIIEEAEIKELIERFNNGPRRRESFSVVVLRRVLVSHELLRSDRDAWEKLARPANEYES